VNLPIKSLSVKAQIAAAKFDPQAVNESVAGGTNQIWRAFDKNAEAAVALDCVSDRDFHNFVGPIVISGA
jgi:hypothetical protein